GLDGSMLAMGGTKGAMLALMVELLVTSLAGAALGFEASSFFLDEGIRPRIGQAFLVIDPGALAGRSVYDERIEMLVAAMTVEAGVCLPGGRRQSLAQKAIAGGNQMSAQLQERLSALAGRNNPPCVV